MFPLYVLQLGGTVVVVALMATLYNLIQIPASIFWGSITDSLHRRRLFFLLAYAGSLTTFVLMFLTSNLFVLAALYSVLGFVVVANSVASNLLIIELTKKPAWVSSFANLSLIANLGSIVGLAIGLIWTTAPLPLAQFLLFTAAATAASLLLAFFLIIEPAIPFERIHLTFHPTHLLARIYHGVTGGLNAVTGLVLVQPSPTELGRIARAIRAGVMKGRALLFLSTFLFMIATGVLNTPFIPYLSSSGVLNNEVFALSLVNVAVQTIVYRGIRFFTSRLGDVRTGSYAIVVRTAMYILVATSALIFRETALFAFVLVVYTIVGVTFALWNASTSVVLFSNLGPENQGGLMGVYSALSSFGLVLGAFSSGYLSFYFGYSLTFAAAGLLMISSFFVLEASLRHLSTVETIQVKT